MIYYDTGVLVKLYTLEPESPQVRQFVLSREEPLPFHSLHRSECASAFHLKAFLRECSLPEANRVLADMDADVRSGVLADLSLDWDKVWELCFDLARSHASETGCRTLDTLHVACALELGCREFATSDRRQALLAERLGFTVHNPAATS